MIDGYDAAAFTLSSTLIVLAFVTAVGAPFVVLNNRSMATRVGYVLLIWVTSFALFLLSLAVA